MLALQFAFSFSASIFSNLSYNLHPNLEGSHNSNQRLKATQLKNAATELDRASSFDSGFPSSGHYSSPDFIEKGVSDITPVIKIEIPAKSNLGISIVGGKNKPEGPHIYVKEVIQGCDAYLVKPFTGRSAIVLCLTLCYHIVLIYLFESRILVHH